MKRSEARILTTSWKVDMVNLPRNIVRCYGIDATEAQVGR